MRSVLILGARSPVALDHARRFAAQGWRVVVGDSMSCRLSAWSRAAHARVSLPAPRRGRVAYASALNRAIAEHRIDLVLPTCEEVFHLSRCRPMLPRSVRVLADAPDKLEALHSKWRFLDLAVDCGAGVPASQRVTSVEEAREWAGDRPVVIKPEFSRFGVHVRLYPEGMPARARPFELATSWVAQVYCQGTELCSYSVVDRGRVQAHACYRPSYRLHTSASYVFEPRRKAAIRAFVEAFARKMDFTGQLSFDWIESETGCHVLECNPRATSGVHLFSHADALPDALMGEAGTCVTPSNDRPCMLGPVMMAAGFLPSMRQRPLRTWWRDFRHARDVISPGADRWPLMGGLLDLGAHVGMAVRERCSLRQAATMDIEWNGEISESP